LVLGLCASLVSSCATGRLRRNVKNINERGIIQVEAIPAPGPAKTYALAWPSTSRVTNDMTAVQSLGADGLAVFLLLQNRTYNVAAFTDLDGNGAYDGGEPVAIEANLHPAPLTDTAARAVPVKLKLSATNGLPRGQRLALPLENVELGESLPIKVGEIANLDDPKFSSAVGEMGMWQPFDFLRQYGVGIYFLEPYDPHKEPVLFVYGIAGSLQDWRAVLEKIDRRKYQPWLVHYPSGIRLDKTANALAVVLLQLRRQYHFERLAVVAHSMGGLVARGAIQRTVNQAGTNFIPVFVSISTPWHGHEGATFGVKHLNYPVPAWRDMVPGSDYQRDIMAQPLPPGTRYHLIFGYQSSGGLGLPDENDGVVAVESELFLQAQAEAVTILGLHLDHMGILKSPEVMQRIEKALAH
jgi:hypothetical protein